VGRDPVELGLVASLNRPGGNLTGVTVPFAEIAEKRLDLLHQAVPAADTIALLARPADEPYWPVETRYVQSAARTLGLRLLVFNITTDADVELAFATLTEQRAGAILAGASPIVDVETVGSRVHECKGRSGSAMECGGTGMQRRIEKRIEGKAAAADALSDFNTREKSRQKRAGGQRFNLFRCRVV
jgi:hypothetical protein